MPLGTHHRMAGTLRWTEHGFTLFPDDGGYWALDVPWHLKRLARTQLERRLIVAGTRCGFNDLAVTEMEVV